MIDTRTKACLLDMRDNARIAVDFLGDKQASDVAVEAMRAYALNRAVEIVGEAASRIDATQRQAMPTIPWRQAIDMRNLLIHGYDMVRIDIVVDTVRKDFPNLIAEIERLLNEEK